MPLVRVVRGPVLRLLGCAPRAGLHTRAPSRSNASFLRRVVNQFTPSHMPRKDLNEPWDMQADYTRILNVESKPSVVSTLPNGVRLVSTETQNPVTSFGVLVDYGSRYEVDETAGAARVLEKMTFQSNRSVSSPELRRLVQSVGGNVTANAMRESIYYTTEAVRDHAPLMLSTVGDAILHNNFDEWEVSDVIESVLEPFSSEKPPKPEMMDLVYQTAYGGQTLGRSLLPDPPQFIEDTITPDVLRQVVATYFQPSRIVLSATGISHSDFVALAEQSPFGHLKASGKVIKAPAEYVGGDARNSVATPDGLTQFAICFESEALHSPDLVATVVLQMLLGGGSSFSSGGPGKGMHSRLFRHVLNRHPFAVSANAFSLLGEDSSLFGLTGSTYPEAASDMVSVIVDEIGAMGSVNQSELSRAKLQLKSTVFMHLEMRNALLEDSARQLFTFGKVSSLQELAAKIDAVTEKDIARVVQKMLSKRPTFTALGDTTNLPHYEQVASALK